MDDIKKKTSEEEEQKKSEAPPAEKQQEDPKDDKPKGNEPAPDGDQADENGEGAEAKAEEKPEPEEKPTENIPDPKDEEILRLKTQIAAMNLGIKPECVEDAVAVAESYVKSGKASDINAALAAVVKKYPDMKSSDKEAKKGGFKVGADGSKDDNKQDDSKLSQAFGIRKKK